MLLNGAGSPAEERQLAGQDRQQQSCPCCNCNCEAKQSPEREYLCGQRGERLSDNWLHQMSKLELGYSLRVLPLPPPPRTL